MHAPKAPSHTRTAAMLSRAGHNFHGEQAGGEAILKHRGQVETSYLRQSGSQAVTQSATAVWGRAFFSAAKPLTLARASSCGGDGVYEVRNGTLPLSVQACRRHLGCQHQGKTRDISRLLAVKPSKMLPQHSACQSSNRAISTCIELHLLSCFELRGMRQGADRRPCLEGLGN